MTEPASFHRGDAVVIQTDDKTVSGYIVLASENGISLLLCFEAMIGRHAGMMPVLHDYGENYKSIIDGHHVRVRRAEP
jgi:hypothetical protein